MKEYRVLVLCDEDSIVYSYKTEAESLSDAMINAISDVGPTEEE
jgi:hypothetical protein